MELDVDSFNRLSLGIIEKYKLSPEAAIEKLQTLNLNILCGEDIRHSIPLQAALITTVNTAKRAFLGGVFIIMPKNVKMLLPWSSNIELSKVINELGGTIVNNFPRKNLTLSFGLPASVDDNAMQVVCNDWQGGILTDGSEFTAGFQGKIPTAGVFAGGLAVALAFLKVSGINISSCDKNVGLSLWRPDIEWMDERAKGPEVFFLPKKIWILGLGHLGQAYLWNIGLLPYNHHDKPEILLNDFDKLVKGNWSAALLCKADDRGYKSRICSRWLERRGIATCISERPFDENTRRVIDEPFLALCGFDSAKSRLPLEEAGFDFIVEAGLGNNLSTFDIIAFHTFPNGVKSPREIWGSYDQTATETNKTILEVLNEIDKNECGIIPLTIAGKSLSASFVGACSGALAIAEILRGLHGGKRFDKIVFQLRNLEGISWKLNKKEIYSKELARNGWIDIRS